MYELSRSQRETQAGRLRNVDLRLVIAYLKSAIQFVVANPKGPRPFIVCGHRSREEQAVNYAKGRTTPGPVVTSLKPGQSLHELSPARAIDIGFLKDDGTQDFTEKLFVEFKDYMRENLPAVTWGGFWSNPHDCPHFEVEPVKV